MTLSTQLLRTLYIALIVAVSGTAMPAIAQMAGSVSSLPKLTEQERAAHLEYLRSNGVTGTITMFGNKKFELVRLGTPMRNIDYRINNSNRFLREVEHAYRVREGERWIWKLRFRDGSEGKQGDGVGNYYIDTTNGDVPRYYFISSGGGIGSTHLVAVIRTAPGDQPILARLAIPDISEIRLNPIDTSPLQRLAVRAEPTEAERTKWMERWQNAASMRAPVDLTPENEDFHFRNSLCGYGAAVEPMEILYFCRVRQQEMNVAKRDRRMSATTTPALRSNMGPHDIDGRSIF